MLPWPSGIPDGIPHGSHMVSNILMPYWIPYESHLETQLGCHIESILYGILTPTQFLLFSQLIAIMSQMERSHLEIDNRGSGNEPMSKPILPSRRIKKQKPPLLGATQLPWAPAPMDPWAPGHLILHFLKPEFLKRWTENFPAFGACGQIRLVKLVCFLLTRAPKCHLEPKTAKTIQTIKNTPENKLIILYLDSLCPGLL